MKDKSLALLPSVDQLLMQPQSKAWIRRFSQPLIKEMLQEALQTYRARLSTGRSPALASRQAIIEWVLEKTAEAIDRFAQPNLKPVINATGVILHTGLGRAPYARAARDNVTRIMAGYCNLELDLSSGERGERNDAISGLLCRLTGAEAAVMVNNNAAAVLLALNALCFGKEVIVSRGQLIEIGGSFRLPDVMKKSGAIMKEVGTTNKTRLKDYQQAITKNTGALFVAHTSNYRVLGFTEEAGLAELASMAHDQGIPLIHDLGGGVLLDLRRYHLPYEPLVQDSLAAGADVVTFSGDKVLGGPQAGLLVGKRAYIEQIHQDPMMRAVRCDKLVFAAMEATLRLYFTPDTLTEENRTLHMISESAEQVQKRAQTLLNALAAAARRRWSMDLKETFAQIGSGALPLEKIPSWAVVLTPPARKAGRLAQLLRESSPAIVGYVQDDRVFLDMRTVSDEEGQRIAVVLNQLAVSVDRQ